MKRSYFENIQKANAPEPEKGSTFQNINCPFLKTSFLLRMPKIPVKFSLLNMLIGLKDKAEMNSCTI